MIIDLDKVIYGDYVRNYCFNPYPGHKKGCPNACSVRENNPILHELVDLSSYRKTNDHPSIHIIEYKGLGPKLEMTVYPFDIEAHAGEMKLRPRKDGKEWTDAQARCVLYWQKHKVDKPLLAMTRSHQWTLPYSSIILERPEAHGVCCFSTMRHHGLILEKNPQKTLYKMMMIGKLRPDAPPIIGCKKT